MVKVSSITWMATFTTDTGLATKRADLACTRTRRDQDTRASGRRTSSTAKAMKPGQRVPATRANTSKAKSKARASTSGRMDLSTKGTGKTIRLKDMVFISGLTEGNTTVSGEATICTVMEFTFMPMELDTTESM